MSRRPRSLRRLPIYGERLLDWAVRVAAGQPGYSLWAQPDDPCGLQFMGNSVADVDSTLWGEPEPGAADAEDAAARYLHRLRRRAWLLTGVEELLGRSVADAELAHGWSGDDRFCSLRPPSQPGVYAVAGLPGFIKIGRAANIAERVLQLQTGHPVPLRLLAVASADPADEVAIHAQWSRLRVTGEWFQAAPALLDWLASRRATGSP